MKQKQQLQILSLMLCLGVSGLAAPSIQFTYVPPFGSSNDLTGRVAGVSYANYGVAVYIRVAGGWWTKPDFDHPLTAIQPDLTWACDITTGGNDPYASDITAFLVPSSYTPTNSSGQTTLPAELQTNAVAQVSTNRLALHFSGYDWTRKDSLGDYVGPGTNIFSSNASNVWVDAQGRLHLRITHTNDQWHCAEIISQRSFGYGTYRFYLDTLTENLDLNAVLGLFTWSDAAEYTHREIDVELSRWSDGTDTTNAQFVVQPWDTDGHRQRYQIPASLTNTTHSFTWNTNQVSFQSHRGLLLSPPATNPVICQWTFDQSGVPMHGDENARINLWLYKGVPPTDNQPVEVVISRFVFVPAPLSPPVITAVQWLTNGVFRLQATGEPQLTYIFQTSTNLAAWSDLATNLTTEGFLDFLDTNLSSVARRFYRLLVPSQ